MNDILLLLGGVAIGVIIVFANGLIVMLTRKWIGK